MKKILSFFLSVLLLSSLVCARAASPGDERVVVGADLSEEQLRSVYETFGIPRGSVTELTLSNDEERQSLSGLVEERMIGTRSISCVYLRLLEPGQGYSVRSSNIHWVSDGMYRNALVTAGLSDVEVIVTAPFEVSGTAALAGIYKAYEDLTGQELDAAAKEVGTQELVITGELAEEIGSYDAAEIVNELKLILDETRNMTDDELRAEIWRIAQEYNVTLSDAQLGQLVRLCREMEKLDDAALTEKIRSLQETVKKLGEAQEKVDQVRERLDEVREKAEGLREKAGDLRERAAELWEKAGDAWDNLRENAQPVIDFFRRAFGTDK